MFVRSQSEYPSRASKWTSRSFDAPEVKIELYLSSRAKESKFLLLSLIGCSVSNDCLHFDWIHQLSNRCVVHFDWMHQLSNRCVVHFNWMHQLSYRCVVHFDWIHQLSNRCVVYFDWIHQQSYRYVVHFDWICRCVVERFDWIYTWQKCQRISSKN